MISQKQIKELKKIKGKARGVTLKTDIKHIESKMGPKKANEIKKIAKKIDPEFNYDQIRNINWYPLRWRILSLLIIKDYFKWSDEDIKEMGKNAPKNSFFIKIILRYFVSLKKTFEEGENYFKKHYHPGEFEPTKIDLEKKYIIFKIKKFYSHPVLCNYFLGYFESVARLANRSEKTQARESKCKNNTHEFIINW